MDLPFATQRSDNWSMEEVPLGLLGDTMALPISNGDHNKITQPLCTEHGASPEESRANHRGEPRAPTIVMRRPQLTIGVDCDDGVRIGLKMTKTKRTSVHIASQHPRQDSNLRPID